MIARQRHHRKLQLPLLCGCMCFLHLLATAAWSQDQEFEASASRATPEPLVFTDAGSHDQPGIAFAVIVDKSRQQANLYRHDGYWRMVAKWPCSTGKLSGPKEMEGDLRTPEGVYFATRDVGARFLNETYGSRALPLDYPNWLDKRMARSGSAIWLHGTNKPLQARDSNGCIVFENAAIERLAPFIRLNRTPVIIVDRIKLWSLKDARQVAGAILTCAEQWNAALMQGSFKVFRQFYDPSAAPSMKWWQKWCRQRQMRNAQFDCQGLMGQRAIYRWGDDYVLLFDHVLRTTSRSQWVGRRKLYFNLEGNQVRIFGDTYQSAPDGSHNPLIHAWRMIHANEEKESRVAANDKGKQRNYAME